MLKQMLDDLSIIITLFNTPRQKINNLNDFKGIKNNNIQSRKRQ